MELKFLAFSISKTHFIYFNTLLYNTPNINGSIFFSTSFKCSFFIFFILHLSLSSLKQTGKNNNHALASNKSVYRNRSFKATDKRTARLYAIREAPSKAKEIGQARVILMIPNKEIQNLLQKRRYWLGESTRYKTFWS